VELDTWEIEITTYSAVMAQAKQYSAQAYFDMMQQTVNNLRKVCILSDCLIGPTYDETVMLPKHHQNNELTAIAKAYVYKLLLAYSFGNNTSALDYIAKTQPYLMAISGLMQVPIFHFYAALTHLAIFPTKPEPEQSEILALVETHQTTLHQWAKNAPMNYLHKWYLVEAEKYRILGNKADAIELYDRAISLAQENQFLNEEGLANELTAKFYLNWGKEKVAQAYMIEAYYCYARWGAKAKVIDLEKRYPQLLDPLLQQSRFSTSFKENITRGTIASSHTFSSTYEVLDLATMLKASQVISGEMELDKLLTTLLQIVVTNAGASKCVLLLKQDIELQVAAFMEEGQEPQLLPPMPLESSQDVAIALVNTVKRSLKPLVLVDARVNAEFCGDRYIAQHQPKSVLCSPILNQGKLIGILYLENNLTVGAFTSDRVELLNLLCTQAAISLENAQLYERSQQYAQQLRNSLKDLKQAQLQVIQSEKMSALGNLVAGVAHEINNPIGFISGNLVEANRGLQDLIDLDYLIEDLPKMLESMQTGCDRIKFISKSLRTFSRTDSDKKQIFNIHEGIDSTILILRHRLKANELRPEIKVINDYGNVPAIRCFPGQLNQVFMNILANAIDALEESNQVTIQTAIEGEGVKIAISDNGSGIPEHLKNRIFEHLFTTKSVGKGTGLGLAIARQIVVDKHGGAIEVKSTPGVGTEFIIILPP
jgi:signal transduction histidine kinase